ncbi:hypothetical protein D3C73_1139230 [compost metagenome]
MLQERQHDVASAEDQSPGLIERARNAGCRRHSRAGQHKGSRQPAQKKRKADGAATDAVGDWKDRSNRRLCMPAEPQAEQAAQPHGDQRPPCIACQHCHRGSDAGDQRMPHIGH